jgi:predicted ArsR family transcriptional regulator
MERTRDEVLRLLYEHGECSVAELAELIGVSDSSVRRHMDLLVADGLVRSRQVRIPRGRPIARYVLTEAGEEERAAAHYQRLLARLSPALASLTSDEVSGQSGPGIVERLFAHVAESVADEYRPMVTAPDLGERVQQLLVALTDEGILHDAADEGDFFRLRNAACPYRSTAMETSACCSADRRTIELLLGAPVEQVMTVAEGGHQCEYLVPKDATGGQAGIRPRATASIGSGASEITHTGIAGGLLPVVAQKGTAGQR